MQQTISLQTQIIELQTKNNKLTQKLLEKDKLYETKTNELKQENVLLKSQINKNNKFINDYKKMEIEINTLKSENNRLKLRELNNMDYTKWNNDDILIWILSLNNNKFEKYKNVLNKNLSLQNIKGIDLQNMNEFDIQGLGITDFSDKKELIQQIKQLIDQKQN